MTSLLKNMKNVRKINLVYLSAFFGDALFTPFIALYFISIGFSDYQRGVLLALIPISTIIGNFIFGKLSSKLERNVNLLKILGLLNSLIIISFGFIDHYYVLLVLTIIFGLSNSPYFSIQDGVAVSFCDKENKVYSKTRMFGSIGYCLALLFGSYLTSLFNYTIIFLIAGAFFLLVNIILLFVKINKEESDQTIEKKEISYRELFKNKIFIRYILFYLLLNGIWVIGEAYTSTYFNYLEVNDSTYSLMFGIQVGIEVIVILLISKFNKKITNLKYFLIIGCIIICLRYLMMGTHIPVNILLVIVSILRGLGWGGLLSSHLTIVKKILGINLTTKGISLLAILTNLIGTIGNFVAPYIYLGLSFQWLYLLFGIIQGIGIIVLLTINFNFLKEEGEKND